MIEYLFKISADGKAALAETAKVTTALGGIQREAGGAENTLGSMFGRLARTLGPITLALKLFNSVFGAISRYGAISDQAARAGVSAEKFQSWSYALSQSGVQPTALFEATKAVSRQQALASGDPNSPAARTFARLGVTPDLLKSAGKEQLIEMLALGAMNAPTTGLAGSQYLADMQMVLGGQADQLIAAFREGFITRVDEAKSKGLVLSEESVARLDRFGDKLSELGERSNVFFGRLASLEFLKDMNASLAIRSKDDLLHAVKRLDDTMGKAVRILDDKL